MEFPAHVWRDVGPNYMTQRVVAQEENQEETPGVKSYTMGRVTSWHWTCSRTWGKTLV